MRWSGEDAVRLLTLLAEPARRRGFVVAMYGSAITRGDGQDVDLICVPLRPDAEPGDFAFLLSVNFLAREVDRHVSWDGSVGVLYRTDTGPFGAGRLIDVLYVNRT